MAKKYYVVWEGRTPGIYDNWNDCKTQIEAFTNAKYKSFENHDEAVRAMGASYWQYVQKSGKNAAPAEKKGKTPRSAIQKDSLSVDAACSGNPGVMEYRGVWTADGRELFHVGPMPDGTNNIGEFLAIVHGLAFLKKEGKPQMPIYSDSLTGRAWVRNKHAKTTLEPTGRNDEIFDLIERAEKWLANNPVTNPILIWETKDWGEIPADFGRKG